MFGFRQTAISTAVILAGAASALIAASASANAQQGCSNGYRMLKDQIPVACGYNSRASAYLGARDEPLTTGSIRRSESPVIVDERTPHVATGPAACVGGLRWIETPANGDTLPMRCD